MSDPAFIFKVMSTAFGSLAMLGFFLLYLERRRERKNDKENSKED